MRRLLSIGLSVLLLLTLAWPAAAALTERTLLVQVTDLSGVPVEGATLEVYGLGQGLLMKRFTGSDGAVRLTYDPGSRVLWLIRASALGYTARETGWFDPAYGDAKRLALTPMSGDLQLLFRNESGERVNADFVLLAADGRLVAQDRAIGGRVSLSGLAAGQYRLTVSAAGYASAERSVTVSAGRMTLETITLARGDIRATGEVVDAVTQAPLHGVRVELLQGEAGAVVAEAETALTGRFNLSAPAGGSSFRLRVTAPNYKPLITAAQSPGSGRYLDFSGQNRIRLEPATGSIVGSLTTIGGRSIPRATMVLLREDIGEVAQVKSDNNGDFRFDGIPAGFRYKIIAYDSLDPITVDWLDLAESDWIEVKPGGTVQTTVTPQEWPVVSMAQGTVTGRVLTPAGLPVEGAKVELIRWTHEVRTTTTDADGRFIFESVEATGGAAAPYSIRISADGYLANRLVTVGGMERTTFDVSVGGRMVVEATLQPSLVDLKGRVVDPSGQAVRGARVALALDDQSEARVTTTDESGWYQLREIPTNSAFAALRVTADGYLPAGGVEVTSALGAEGALPVIQLTPQTTAVEGVVVGRDGRPVSDAKVTVTSSGQVLAEGVTDGDGYYHLEADLTRAGVAVVTAAKEGYTGSGLSLSATAPGERFEQMLLLQPASAVLEGRLLDASGLPVGGVSVELLIEGQGVAARTVTGADGRYRFEARLPEGAAWVWLRAEPATGRFGGSASHGLSYVPRMRLTAGDRRVVDLLIR